MRADAEQLAAADAAFGTDLYGQLAGPGSLVFSPASVAAALRMALVGARGETAVEMARVLHLASAEAARQAQGRLARIPASDVLTLRVVNTAWIDSGLSLREEFLRQPVSVERADFSHAAQAARRAINATVEEQTAGKVSGLIRPGIISALTRLVLVNTIYLKARWQHEFPAGNTRKEPFYPERSDGTPVDMMHSGQRLAYRRGDGFQAVLLPYKGGPLAMAIVLPDGPLSQFPVQALGGVAAVLGGLLASPEEYQVDLRLPKFRIEAQFLLGDTLQALGIGLAFSSAADFGGICDQPLHIDQAIHQAFIDVDERGTEAAAATAAVVQVMAMRRQPARRVAFTADRPFLFAVIETATGLPLFLGQYTGP
ncbi:MAG TPA: serpin family protein [Trebonia sp.]|nr:serpin family protein [Trebonia sp.]